MSSPIGNRTHAVAASTAPAPSATLPDRLARIARSRTRGSIADAVRTQSRYVLLALALSRLLVLAAGAIGATAGRVGGWTWFDPSRTSSSFGSLGNLLAAGAYRWDSVHYLGIAEHGYASAGQTAFFPLYPLLMRAGGWLVGSDVLAGVLISIACFGVSLVLLHRLTEEELGRRAADATVLLLSFAPLSFFFSAVYTESLFLALAVGAVYAARGNRIALACGLVALATVARIYGILLIVPVALIHLREARRVDHRLAWLALPPAALAGFLAYLHSRGYGWLAPVTAQTSTAHAHSLSGPVVTVVQAIQAAAGGARLLVDGVPPIAPSLGSPFSLGFQNVVLLAVLGLGVAALVACWRRLPRAYAAYATLALLLTIASPVQGEPLKSLDRYSLTIFPLWMAVGAWTSERRMTRALVLVGAAALAFYTVEFARWSFVA